MLLNTKVPCEAGYITTDSACTTKKSTLPRFQ